MICRMKTCHVGTSLTCHMLCNNYIAQTSLLCPFDKIFLNLFDPCKVWNDNSLTQNGPKLKPGPNQIPHNVHSPMKLSYLTVFLNMTHRFLLEPLEYKICWHSWLTQVRRATLWHCFWANRWPHPRVSSNPTNFLKWMTHNTSVSMHNNWST